METLIFAIFAALAVGSAIVVVTHKSPIYSTLSLVLTLLSMAVLFVLLGAPFLGALQVLVYAGAIVVLFLFVIMLLNVQKEETAHIDRGAQLWVALLGVAVFLGMFWLAFWRTGLRLGGPAPQALTQELVSLKGLAAELFGTYLLPFEMVGLLLLVAVIGATVAARRPGEAGGLQDDAVYASGEPLGEPAPPLSPQGGQRLSAVPISWYLLLSAVLFGIGAIGALTRRNGIAIFLSVELMLNAANLTLVAYARQFGSHTGQVIVFFVMAVAAAEAAVGLALFIAVFRQRHTIDVNRMNLMRW